MSSYQSLFVFRSRGIQRYILASDKLTEMAGASALVERLCNEWLESALGALGLKHDVIAQAAGGARILFHEREGAKRFAHVWPLLVDQLVPGLEIAQAALEISQDDRPSQVEECVQAALRADDATISRSLPAMLPAALANPRNGEVACERSQAVRRKGHLLDRGAAAKEREASRKRRDPLTKKFGTTDARWPRDLTRIASDDHRYVAVVHIDGNQLGKILVKLQQQVEKLAVQQAWNVFRELSKAVKDATEDAARRASELSVLSHVRDKRVPARPIVLGGDDLTMILRADIAPEFARIYMETFRERTEAYFTDLRKKFHQVAADIPPHLTAAGGIAYVRASFPFHSAHDLAVGLCDYSKKATREECTVSFHRVTTTLETSFDEILQLELRGAWLREDEKGNDVYLQLTMQPYCVRPETTRSDDVPEWSRFMGLVEAVERAPRSALHEVAELLHADPEAAVARFERLRRVRESDYKAVRKALRALTGTDENSSLWDARGRTPLLDAIAHVAATRGAPDSAPSSQEEEVAQA